MTYKFYDKDGENSLEVFSTGAEKIILIYAIENGSASIPLELHVEEVKSLIEVLKLELDYSK